MEDKIQNSKIESTNPYQGEVVREDLAALLARLASLQGVAVAAHRFVYQQQAESGVSLEDMPVIDYLKFCAKLKIFQKFYYIEIQNIRSFGPKVKGQCQGAKNCRFSQFFLLFRSKCPKL